MKVAGIIAEYNPFHNGHQYHIEETKRQTGADYVIALMSGDVVQRGAPAFLDKYERTFCALAGGCDLVLELPAVYSSASAEFFAAGAVSILDRLGVSDWLSFGSEEGNLEPLQSIAQILIKEPEKYKKLLRSHLKSGLSFPLAREKALSDYGKSCLDGPLSDHIILSLKGANNILALEYLKSLYRISSTIRPHTVLRKDAPYHDKNFHDEIASASAIREHLKSQAKLAPVLQTVPEETASFLSRYTKFPDHNSLTPYLHGTLLNGNHWDDILDWDKEMANRLSSLPWSIMTFSEIADGLKSKNITHSRIHRALLHLILQIEKGPFMDQFQRNPAPYARILGFRKESSSLLRQINDKGSIPLITKPASILKAVDAKDQWMWEKDLAASRLYQSISFQEFGRKLTGAYERSPVIY